MSRRRCKLQTSVDGKLRTIDPSIRNLLKLRNKTYLLSQKRQLEQMNEIYLKYWSEFQNNYYQLTRFLTEI